MKPGSFISKEESKLLQGVAVSLMVFLHLFAFPERVFVSFSFLFNIGSVNLETLLAYFGGICVSIFAFNSGYGMRKGAGDLRLYRLLPGYQNILKRLWSFAQRFWIVFVVFIGAGLLMNTYTWEPISLLRSFLGLNYSHNEEWWYIGQYLEFLAIFPLLMLGLKMIGRMRFGNWIHLLVLLLLIIVNVIFPTTYISTHLFSFLIGIYLASVPVYEWVDRCLAKHPFLYSCISFICLAFAFAIRTILAFGSSFDYLITPFFVFGFVGLLKCNFIRKVLSFVLHLPGKYSTYIWLTHTFFGYYLFQKFTFFPKYSPLIFLWCMILSIASGWILESLLTLIHKGFKTLKERSQK